MALTAEQQELVTNNHQLIYGFCNQRNISLEENYDLCAIGLCKAAEIFDPSRGLSFSTLAYRCMANEVQMQKRKENTIARKADVSADSLDRTIKTDGGTTITLHDVLSNTLVANHNPLSTVMFKDFYESLTEQEKIVIAYRMAGLKQREIAERIHKSRAYVCMILSRVKEKVARYTEII